MHPRRHHTRHRPAPSHSTGQNQVPAYAESSSRRPSPTPTVYIHDPAYDRRDRRGHSPIHVIVPPTESYGHDPGPTIPIIPDFGPFDRGRQPSRHPRYASGHGYGGHGSYSPEVPVVVQPLYYGSPPDHIVRTPSPSPSRSPSRAPSPYYEPTLTPWAHYVDDKYTDEWTRLANALHEHDESYIEDCKDDIDTLLVFVSSICCYRSSVSDAGCIGRFILGSSHRVQCRSL